MGQTCCIFVIQPNIRFWRTSLFLFTARILACDQAIALTQSFTQATSARSVSSTGTTAAFASELMKKVFVKVPVKSEVICMWICVRSSNLGFVSCAYRGFLSYTPVMIVTHLCYISGCLGPIHNTRDAWWSARLLSRWLWFWEYLVRAGQKPESLSIFN